MKKEEFTVNSPESIRVRLRLFGFLLFLPWIILGGKFFCVQIIQGERYFSAARDIYTRKTQVSGQRGEIFDRSGNLLVANSPRLNVECTPYNLKDDSERRRLAAILARHFPPRTAQWYYQRLSKHRLVRDRKTGKEIERRNNYLLVKRNATLDEVREFRKSITPTDRKDKRQNLLRLFNYKNTAVRTYPKGTMLANLLGYVDIEDDMMRPRNGLERRFDRHMTPDKVVNIYEHTPAGRPVLYGKNRILEPADGMDLYLTIMEPVQAILEEELDAVMEKWRPDGLFAAVADPKTGELLAIAQRPSFDPGNRSTFTGNAVRMRCATDLYEPGSLAKPFSVLYALERKLVKPETLIDCEKGRWAAVKLTDSHPYGNLSVAEVIQKSSNIGTAKIAMLLGKQGVYHALSRFGFGAKSGLPFAGEQAGMLRRPARWNGLDITRIPIGYTFNTTVLQLLRAYCGLANNGLLPERLKLIHGIRDPETGVMTLAEPVPFRRTGAAPEDLYKLIDMMIMVTRPGGTAVKAGIPGFQVAGKTGTSRKNIEAVRDPVTKKILVKSHYASNQYYASFAGFVPAHDPRLVMVITLDNPKGASYGGVVAAPAFSRTMERCLRYFNVQPTEPVPEKKKR